jgi:hypothetical protein
MEPLLLLQLLGGTFAGATTAITGGANATQGPCDIYAAGGTPCVAAHSTTRALYGAYRGRPLYQARRLTDNATLDIAAVASVPGGPADAAALAAFCAAAPCVVQTIYDQSPRRNDLHLSRAAATPNKERPKCLAAMASACAAEKDAGSDLCVPCLVAHLPALEAAGCNRYSMDTELWCGPDRSVNATQGAVTVGGHPVYGLVFEGGMGYRAVRKRRVFFHLFDKNDHFATTGSGQSLGNGCKKEAFSAG